MIAALGLLCSATAAQAASSVTLAPVGPWNVEWSPTTCSLRRLFGTKEKPSLVIMERFGPTDHFQLTLSSNEFRAFQQGQSLKLTFGDREPHRLSGVTPGRAVNGTPALFFGNQSLAAPMGDGPELWTPPVTPATEAATTTISVKYNDRERIFAVGPLRAPFEALRKCTDDLLASWGLDPKQQATLTERPKPLSSPATWLRGSDYPDIMRGQGKQAIVNFRLSVDPKGMPTACEVQRSYNDKIFDEVTCAALLRRARFSPAQDAKGQPVASYHLNTVRWIMG